MRVYNFSAGPSVLPVPVLERSAAEMLDTNGTGQSVMEMSHRSKEFKTIIDGAETKLRELMKIPANYKVLFLQGGASLQFAMVPLNLAAGDAPGVGKKASYIDTGIWADRAAVQAAEYAQVEVRASSKDRAYSYIPTAPAPNPGDAYYHIVVNNTIVGTKWAQFPETGDVPLVGDISSCILSEALDVSKFGLLYAGAQKNLGPSGVTVVIVRDDLVGHAPSWVPIMLRYDTHTVEGSVSMYNTPPCYGIYIMGLVLDWVKGLGGVPAVEKMNKEKAALFYDYLDNSKLFRGTVEKPFRSLMNIPFVVTVEDKEKKNEMETRFVKEAHTAGFVNLGGHKLVGGMRASIYNAMEIEGIKALIQFMEKFEAQNS
ncbi:MAG: 3-phosphoserine/phosphohydroxythreonine transaminase [Spirochaetes bacterium]|nr:3-phosphoserine/phosphohydroxythreonine transaminase [Spirochaetota bacterium]